MKINNGRKKIQLLLIGVAFLATFVFSYYFILSHWQTLNHLPFDISEYQINFRALFLVSFAVFIVLAGLFSKLAKRILTKHRLTEEQYRGLVELSNDIITVADRDGKHVFLNEAAYRILEWSPEEVIGRPFTELLHPADRGKALAKNKVLEKSDTGTYSMEARYITKSGNAINVLQVVHVLKDANGSFIGAQSIARDITDLKQTKDALQKTLQQVEDERVRSDSVLSAIEDGVSIQGRDFKILYQNQAHKTMTGGSHLGQACYQVFGETDDICRGCPVAEVFKDGNIHRQEKRISTDGEIRYLEIKASPLIDAAGKISAGIEVVSDITARKNLDEQLMLLSAAIEDALDGIQIIDLDGRIVNFNKAMRELYNCSREELEGKYFDELNAGREIMEQFILQKTGETGRWSGELSIIREDGGAIPVWLSMSLVKDDRGQPIAMIGIMRDITGRRSAESNVLRDHEQLAKLVEERTRDLAAAKEQLQMESADRQKREQELLNARKLESFGGLASGIANDFNNLLSSIMGNIAVAMKGLNADDPAYRQLEGAEKASLRAQDLTRQLLMFAKGGAPVKSITSVIDLIRDVTGFTQHSTRVKFFYSLPENLWLADIDEGQISQVIQNLIVNADHAMPEGGTITISSENAVVVEPSPLPLRSGNYVMISIRDHGVGISQKHLSKIFDPEFTTKEQGSGLGLAMSYSIIKQHGGHIFAESERGKGTTFTIYLPASLSEKATKIGGDLKLVKGAGRILLLDDDEDVRQTTGYMLMRLGYTVEFVNDGELAIDLYQEAIESGTPFDAVIMDLTIPGGMGGEESLKKLLEIDPDIKAIASTGYANDPIISDFRSHGFSGVIPKPCSIAGLDATLHAVLQDKATGFNREQSSTYDNSGQSRK
jgi:PAS domain S-box-containing protein